MQTSGKLVVAAASPFQYRLSSIVEAAYKLFAPYKLGNSLDVCKACCVTDEEEQVLLTTPLREITSRMLFQGYFESARSHSETECWQMKHFLPRVLELVAAFDFPCHSTEITFLRLDLDYPTYWLPAERVLLDTYALAFLTYCLDCYPLPGGETLADILVMFGLAHFYLAPLLHCWATTDTPPSIAHFADLLLNGLRYPARGPVELSSSFSKPYVDEQLAGWLTDPAVRALWATRLENAILQNQLSDEQATRASLAYEVLTIALAPS